MTASDERLTIGTFAAEVGLSPSALRFYDDCGVLRPAWVDPATGYRYYALAQRSRARLLRDLRAVDLPLAGVRAVLDGPPDDAALVLREHAAAAVRRAESTATAALRLLDRMTAGGTGCTATLGGPELASAIRQVAPAAAGATTERPVLRGTLLEVGGDELALVATDRQRLAVRRLQPLRSDGSSRIVVPTTELSALSGWFAAGAEVTLEVRPGRLVLSRAGAADQHELAALAGDYPDYRAVLDDLTVPATRVVVDRVRLLDEIRGRGTTVVVTVGPDRLTCAEEGAGQVELPAICTGEQLRVGFDPALLAAALSASVGPDVLLELVGVRRPVVVRSADQGTFTTLVMPVALDS